MCLCCFLTVSFPINAILGSLMFWFFTHYEDKGKLGCPTLPEEKVAKITFLPLQLLQSLLEHGSKIFLP